MAVVTAPLLSFGARGSIAKSQVYASWKGRPYARRYTVPAYRRSDAQDLTRNVFSWLNNTWKFSPQVFQAPWVAFAQGKVLTDRNAFFSQNIGLLRTLTTNEGMIMSPGAKGGIGVTPAVTPASTSLAIAGTAPDVTGLGWTTVSWNAVLMPQQNPQTDILYAISAATPDTTGPYSVTISGLTTATGYIVGAWFVWQRSASPTDLAYGPSVGTLHTTS
jgi:hypothetical protein